MLRRGRLVLLAVAVGAATTFAALPGQAETLRAGLARAQLARVVPYVGIPSVGAGIGVAQAEVQGGNGPGHGRGGRLRHDVDDPRRGGRQVARPAAGTPRSDHRRRP